MTGKKNESSALILHGFLMANIHFCKESKKISDYFLCVKKKKCLDVCWLTANVCTVFDLITTPCA